MSANELLDTWMHSIGKESIQAFQDSFAALTSISLCLVRLDGTPVTVASNKALFCFEVEDCNSSRCKTQHQQLIDKMAATKQTAIDSCYAGLTCFASPIIHQKDVVGAFSGGMVIRKSDTASNPLAHTRFDVTELDEETINRIANLLDATLALLQDDRTPQDRLGDERESELVHDFGLTSREIMITDQIVRNRSNLEIAEVLFISEKTVKTHISNILKNTRVKNRYELAAICKSYFDN